MLAFFCHITVMCVSTGYPLTLTFPFPFPIQIPSLSSSSTTQLLSLCLGASHFTSCTATLSHLHQLQCSAEISRNTYSHCRRHRSHLNIPIFGMPLGVSLSLRWNSGTPSGMLCESGLDSTLHSSSNLLSFCKMTPHWALGIPQKNRFLGRSSM